MKWTDRTGWRAAGTAAVLLVTGAVLGIAVDRHWLGPAETHATPLTAEAMASRLSLSPAAESHVRALLDSLHAEILTAIEQGPEALTLAVRKARHRIEAALPSESRAEFRAWMHEHHEQVTGRLHGGHIRPGNLHGPDSPGGAADDHERRR